MIAVRKSHVPNLVRTYGWERLRAAYPQWTDEDLWQLLRESSWIYDFEPFTQLRVRPVAGRFVTIDPAGFRHVADQAPWPPEPGRFTIFTFGGSNTLGSGLPDGETIPSVLQALIRQIRPDAQIYNFGRSYFYSTQERILFEQQLLHGRCPDLAIFVDGLNEFVYPNDEPQWSQALVNMVSTRQKAVTSPISSGWSVIRWFLRTGTRRLVSRMTGRPRPVKPVVPDGDSIDATCRRWFRNRSIIEAVAAEFAVRTAYVLQPVPMYGYDLSHHLFRLRDDDLTFGPFLPARRGYERLLDGLQNDRAGANTLWLGDLQQDYRRNLYVDNVHYDAFFSAVIARKIFDFLQERKLLQSGANTMPVGE